MFKRLFKRRQQLDVASGIAPLFEKIGENLTPNLRALRLAMSTSDILLSMGVSANSVVARALDITETYCAQPVHIDIAANLLMVSQLRGIEKEPLTLIRPVAMRDVNHMTIQAVQKLIYEINEGGVTLTEAENRFDQIIQAPKAFPWWIITLSYGALVSGVSLMFTSSWEVILTTFVIGTIVERLLYFFSKRAFPAFFRQVIAATFVTLAAATINKLSVSGVSFFSDTNPTLIVVGGIVMLVAGLAVVGAIQDAIEEYYITANSRMLRVLFQTTGIVIGIMIGLYTARKLGIGIAISPNPLHLNTPIFQIIGAGVAAAGYALSTHTKPVAVVWVGIIGASALTIMYSSINWFDISVVPASGIAAAFVGLVASFMSRFWNTPSVGIISAGIVPLVPGLMLYNGLMQLINYPPGDPLFFKALGTLFTVATTGLAIAAGASLGSMIGRPFRQKIAADRNLAPFINLFNRQFNPDSKLSIASFILRRRRPDIRTTQIPEMPSEDAEK